MDSGVIRVASKVIQFTPVTETSIYAAGDQIGDDVSELADAVLEIGQLCALESLVVLDKAKQKSDLEILFFNTDPTVASANNAAVSIADADMASAFIGSVSIAAADYKDLAASSVATIKNIGLILRSSPDSETTGRRSIYALVMSAGTPTYTGASDLVISVGVTRY